jgi:hypothetical protein
MIVSYCFIPLKSSYYNKEEGVNKSVVVATTEKEIKINTLNLFRCCYDL